MCLFENQLIHFTIVRLTMFVTLCRRRDSFDCLISRLPLFRLHCFNELNIINLSATRLRVCSFVHDKDNKTHPISKFWTENHWIYRFTSMRPQLCATDIYHYFGGAFCCASWSLMRRTECLFITSIAENAQSANVSVRTWQLWNTFELIIFFMVDIISF